MAQTSKTAIFAGGCFWCEEEIYKKQPGVISVISGYTGGHVDNPTYEQVCGGHTGHVEAVKVTYDPNIINYETLLDLYWRNIDPFDPEGQFCDQGESYKAVIFYTGSDQEKAAEKSKVDLEKKFCRAITTEIRTAAEFYPAEEYHQDFAKKNPLRYGLYRGSCGREPRLREIWGKKD